MNADLERVKFFKNRIVARLEELRPYMSDVKYRLYQSMIADCTSLDEIREMAELDLQFNMIKYLKDLEDKLKLSDTNIEELEAVTNQTTRAAKLSIISPKKSVEKTNIEIASEVDLSTLGEDLEDEEILASAANILMMRLATMPPEEMFREELENYEENHLTIDDIDDISVDDSDYYTGEDEEELEEEDDADLFEDINEEELGLYDESPSINEIKSDFSNNIDDDSEIIDLDADSGFSLDDLDSLDTLESQLFNDLDNKDDTDDLDNDFEDIDESELFGEYDDTEDDETEDTDWDSLGDDLFDDSEDIGDDDESEDTDWDSLGDDLFDDSIDFEDDSEDDSEGTDWDSLGDDLFDDSDDDIDEDDNDDFEDDLDDNSDDLDNIDADDLFGDDDDDLEDDIDNIEDFEDDGIDDIEFEDVEPEDNLDDFDDFFKRVDKAEQLRVETKPKREITSQKIFLNGTKRGEQTQQMFNMLNGIFGNAGRIANKTSSNIKKKVVNGANRINNSEFLTLRR